MLSGGAGLWGERGSGGGGGENASLPPYDHRGPPASPNSEVEISGEGLGTCRPRSPRGAVTNSHRRLPPSRMHWNGEGRVPLQPPFQGPSLCQAALSLTPTASPSGSCNRQ